MDWLWSLDIPVLESTATYEESIGLKMIRGVAGVFLVSFWNASVKNDMTAVGASEDDVLCVLLGVELRAGT